MKSKIAYFFGGVIACFIGMISFWEYTHSSYTHYQFGDTEKSTRFISFLESSSILYSYKIDHLKRHWVIPHIEDKETRIKTMAAFEATEENRANRK